MVLSKQNKKAKKQFKKKDKKGKKKKFLQNCRSTKAGFIEDHELCTNWFKTFFSSSVVYLAKQTFLRVSASHLPLHALCIFDVHVPTYVHQIYVRACVRACPCAPRHTASHAAFSIKLQKTDIFKLGMEVKNLRFCFFVVVGVGFVGVLFFCFVLFFDLLF